MIELRKRTPALIYGDYKDLDPQHPSIFAYTRSLGADKYLVVLNLSKDNVVYTLPEGLKAAELALSNSDAKEEHVTAVNLKAWEARIYRL
jgi:oligo-1,6-glucosidase